LLPERKIRRPLEGVRAIAVEQYGAGLFGTLYPADMGTDVIKIDAPRAGDLASDVYSSCLFRGDE
jgi:crotonobetainyl-CoA:carnitine CoA-transferase CaiB-like acyl-CoA transferase